MTDTGQIPGEGLPENAVGDAAHQPHTDALGAPLATAPGWGTEPPAEHGAPGYAYLDQPAAPGAGLDEDDDVLLMPGPQGTWSDPQPVPPQPAPVHDTAAPGFGTPQGTDAPSLATPAPRRPLHMGPPIHDTPSGGVSVRSLADRGPAQGGPVPPPVRPQGAGSEHLDAAQDEIHGIPAQQTGEPTDPAAPAPGSAWPAAQSASQQSLIPHADSVIPSQQAPGPILAFPPAEAAPPAPEAPVPVLPVAEAAVPVEQPVYAAEPVAVVEPDVEPAVVSGGEAEAVALASDPEPVAAFIGEPGPEHAFGGEPSEVTAAPGAEPVETFGADAVAVAPAPGAGGEAGVPVAGAVEPVAAPVAVPMPMPMPVPAPVQTVDGEQAGPASGAEQAVYAGEPGADESVPGAEPVAPAAVAEADPATALSAAGQAAAPAPVGPEQAAPPSGPAFSAPPAAGDGAFVPATGTADPASVAAAAADGPAQHAASPAPAAAAPAAPDEAAAEPAEAVAVTEAAPEAVAAPAGPEAVPGAADAPATETAPADAPAGLAVPSSPTVTRAGRAHAAAAPPQDEDAGAPVPADGGTGAEAPTGRRAARRAEARAAEAEVSEPAEAYEPAVRDAVHRVIRERRDVRNGFRSDPIPHDVLLRVLEAAHTAPSVGHSQPWDFVVIRSEKTREKMHELAMTQREAYAKSLPKGRARQFRELKIEAILDTPVNIVVTADPTRGGRHTLGRHTQPQMAPYSAALAVENLWLAARAEGLGVGWVSFFDERQMVAELGLPEHLEVVAYLCVGYVDEFPDEPELMQSGWSQRRPLAWVVHEEEYGNRALPGEEPQDLLEETLRGIRPLDAKALGEAWERQKRMTKPAGALGMLEIISAQLSGLSRQCPPPIPEPAAVAIFAGDHGVHAQGVTAWPQEVTAQMVANFLGGGAVCNAFANQVGAEICVIDVGVATELPSTPGLLPRKVRPGTADFTAGPAMAREEALRAVEVGIETARDLVAAGNRALLTGEMGIANTTTSAALIAVYTGLDPAEVTGRGTGINDEMHARKVEVVRRALDLHRPDPADPIAVLTAIGGLEHAAMVGLLLGAAALRTPVILDGVSAGAAALVARAIAPEVLAACIAGHRSAEPGHVAALTTLGLRPLVDLDLRLGEGTGALLALPLVQSAARVMHEVATFDAAGVTEKA
ncbi:nicotinate-nucleotide--dimethylbenzimidazole phosphoribosyltransferase [Streptomyces sp. IBSBF 2435]|uniref:nicotinate-nucleotide--dimethylbenzimidazole phosphoribosyltransferase n=1 Tax=Streptomyces sp. IBSBF 2435 TaxID=2903531 RepID=UPI002FDC28BA